MASTVLIIVLQNLEKALLKRWSVINFTVFTLMKKVMKMLSRKICGEAEEIWMLGLKNKAFYINLGFAMETMRKVEVLNQKCGICFENPSVCAFLQCGYQYLCENCCQKK